MLGTLTFVASIALARGECPECRVESSRTVLCAPHAESERTTLRTVGAAYAQSTDLAARIEYLETVARLTREHENAPSPAVARFLANGLGASEIAERRRALALLLGGQHREETVAALVQGWREAQKAWRVIDAKLVLGESREDPAKTAILLSTDELVEAPAYVEELIRAIGRVRDEKLLPAVREMLRAPLDRTPGRFVVAAAETALAMHCRRATEGVLDLLDELDAATAEGRLPRRFAGEGAGLLSTYKARLENAGADERRKIDEALARYAAARELGLPDPETRVSAAAWRAWYKSARDRIPDRPTP